MTASTAIGPVVTVLAGGHAWSLPLAVVRRVVRLPAWRPAPAPRPAVLGLVDVHGTDVPLLDLAHAHGLPAGTWQDGDLVLCELDGAAVGLAVDRALGVRADHEGRLVEVDLALLAGALDG